nr:uncharacterized protein LOC116651205 [Drosophila virilis]
MFLSSLPDTWENFVIAIETRDELPKFEVVKVKMLEEATRKQERASRDGIGTPEAVYTHKHNGPRDNNSVESKGRKNSSKQPFRGKCFNCEKKGIERAIAEIKRRMIKRAKRTKSLYA